MDEMFCAATAIYKARERTTSQTFRYLQDVLAHGITEGEADSKKADNMFRTIF